MLNITLANGEKVSIERGSYVIQAWYNGMWHNLCAFPNTKAGQAMAASVIEHVDGDAQIEQFM